MKKFDFEKVPQWVWLALAGEIILLSVLGYFIYDLQEQRTVLEVNVAELATSLQETQRQLATTEGDRDYVSDELAKEKAKLDSVGNAFEEIKDTVGVLDKLSKLDEELLQKYSKVYFLNEHYVPKSLVDIDEEYLYTETDEEQIDKKVWRQLEKLLEDALDDEVEIYIASAYRSFNTQESLKSGYAITYGSGANTFSADQGYSEHQLGTTVDFLTTGIDGTLAGFENTEAYQWLLDNAYKYGFALSYPQGNTYYIFEPWHWRFVGKDLADDLHDDKINFYDMPQRAIDEYLIDIFD